MERLRFRINNIKTDYINKITTEIVRTKQPKTIVMETLNISGMLKNSKLSNSIFEIGLFNIKSKIRYKSEWNGVKFIEADQFYASSKLCSKCKYHNPDLKLRHRTYVCPSCGSVMDRDLNAAINLEHLAS